MPIYEYRCLKCESLHEIMQKITDPALTSCPDCGGEMTKLISNTSFVLKGGGWYKTDYASSGNSPSVTEKKTDKPSPDEKGKSEAVKSEAPVEKKAVAS